ncbi:hypothetical protein JL720_11420 [Aureococcus anophagefferens]|nr:hypothetical protein JL720_11420 [Aureococcus anophagefferens]
MGVRGLKKLAKKHGTIAIVPRGATLHIDASGLMGVLLRGDRFEYGGAPHALEAALADFLLGLLDRGYACSVYRDGSGRRMKARTAAKRLAKRAEEWAALERYARRGADDAAPRRPVEELPAPYLAKKVFGAALDRLALLGDPRLTVVRCVEEADPEIARAAAADGGYVLGEDSDYLLFRDVNYVSLDDGRRLLDGKPVAVYTRAALAASLGLSEDVLVELALLLGNDYTGHFNAEDCAIEGLGEKLRRSPDARRRGSRSTRTSTGARRRSTATAARWTLAARSTTCGPGRRPLAKVREEALDGSPAVDAGGTCAPDGEHRLFLRLRETLAVPGRAMELEPVVAQLADDLARRLDDDEADALAEMLERFPDRLLEAHLPPYWSDAQAAYRYQYAVAKSGIFDHAARSCGPTRSAPCSTGRRSTRSAPAPPRRRRRRRRPRRRRLPIDAHRDEILRTIRENRVTIICGETGCGKSSRLPLMLLEADKKAKMFVSQPRRIAARSLCDRVRETKGGEVGLRLGHGERNETKRTRLWFCTTGYLVRLVASYPGALANHTHLIIDEVHERSVDTEILVLLARRLVESHPSLKLVLMSATVCVDLYAGYFDVDVARAAIHVGARRYPVDIFYADDVAERLRLPRSAAGKLAQETAPSTPGRRDKTPNQSTQHKVVAEIVRAVGTAGSSVLVFVAGMADILELTEKVDALNVTGRARGLTYVTTPIHSDVPFEDQLAVFSGAGAGTVRVILATNAAESGVTIPDCDHVIDLGLAKQIVYNAASHRSLLSQAWISKSSAVQRAGRTGRVRPGHVYRLYAKERYDALDEHATSEIHRCPLDATVLNLMTLSNATDLSAADMLAETVEPPSEAAVARSFAELHASGFIDSPDSDEAQVTAMGNFVSALGVDLKLGHLCGLGAQLGMLGDATTLAAALSLPKSPWRIANPLVHDDPDEYAAIATASYLSRCRWDKGMHSEPVALVRLARAFDKTKNARAFCAAHNVVESRSRQLVSSANNLLKRALGAMAGDVAKKHAAHAAREAATDCRRDAARLNRLRLLLVWTSGDAIFELARVKSPAATHRVAVTRAPLAPEQVAKLFPPGVDYAFASGVRRVYTMNGVPSDVDVTVEERAVAEVGSSLGFAGRLVDVAFCELAADVAYAVTARGLALFLTAAGRLAAGDLVARLVAKGAATTTLDVRRRDGADATTTSFVVVRKSHPSAGEKKDLKALLDACAAVGVSIGAASVSVLGNVGLEKTVVSSSGVDLAPSLLARLFGAPEHARLDFKVQTPAAKQAATFPREPPADEALFEDLPLGARVLASVAAGHRREKLEVWKDAGDRDLGRHELKLDVATPAYACSPLAGDRAGRKVYMPDHTLAKTSVRALTCFGSDAWTRETLPVPVPEGALAACWDLADAYAAIGESLEPAPALVRQLDAIFGLEGAVPTRGADDEEEEEEDDEEPRPSPATPAILARNGASPAKNGAPVAKNGAPVPKNGAPAKAVPPPPPPPKGDDSALSCCLVKLSLGDKPPRESWVEDARVCAAFHGQRGGATTSGRKLLRASRDAEIRAGWVEAGRRNLATGCVEAVDLGAAPSDAHAKPLYMRLTAAGRRYAG